MQHSDALTTARTALPRLRAELVQRPLLQQQLRLALQSRKLVLLCAPAGYGKTVALAEQLSALPAEYAVAWVAAAVLPDWIVRSGWVLHPWKRRHRTAHTLSRRPRTETNDQIAAVGPKWISASTSASCAQTRGGACRASL